MSTTSGLCLSWERYLFLQEDTQLGEQDAAGFQPRLAPDTRNSHPRATHTVVTEDIWQNPRGPTCRVVASARTEGSLSNSGWFWPLRGSGWCQGVGAPRVHFVLNNSYFLDSYSKRCLGHPPPHFLSNQSDL